MEINKGKDKDKDNNIDIDKVKDRDIDIDEYSENSKNSSNKNYQNDKLKKKTLGINEKEGELIKRSRIVHKGSLKKLNIGNSRKIKGNTNLIKINEKKTNKNDNLKENESIKGIIFYNKFNNSFHKFYLDNQLKDKEANDPNNK
jgi:hypothetical protein